MRIMTTNVDLYFKPWHLYALDFILKRFTLKTFNRVWSVLIIFFRHVDDNELSQRLNPSTTPRMVTLVRVMFLYSHLLVSLLHRPDLQKQYQCKTMQRFFSGIFEFHFFRIINRDWGHAWLNKRHVKYLKLNAIVSCSVPTKASHGRKGPSKNGIKAIIAVHYHIKALFLKEKLRFFADRDEYIVVYLIAVLVQAVTKVKWTMVFVMSGWYLYYFYI